MANPENKQIPYESTQKDIRDAIESVATAIGGISAPSAEDVSYDNSGSGLSATDVQDAVDELASEKVDKEVGKGLSTNDYTDAEKAKLAGIEAGAEVNPTSSAKTATESFETVNGGLLEECIINLEPVQSGSGDPYPAGGGKNKFNIDGFSDTQRTVVASVNNGVLHLQGTVTAGGNARFALPTTQSIPTGSVTLSVSGSNENIRVIAQGDNGFTYTSQYGNFTKTFTITDIVTLSYFYVDVTDGTTVNADVKIQIESGSTATTFASYSNVRPISGHTEVDLWRTGKNVLPKASDIITNNGVTFSVNNDGSVYAKGTASSDAFYTYADSVRLPSGTYVLRGNVSGASATTHRMRYRVNSGTWQYYNGYNDDSPNIVIGENDTFTLNIIVIGGNTVNGTLWYPMVRLASNPDQTFEPFRGCDLYQVQIGSTVYGGYDEIVGGNGKNTYDYIDLGTIAESSWGRATDHTYNFFYCSVNALPSAPDTSQAEVIGVCSAFKVLRNMTLVDFSDTDWGDNTLTFVLKNQGTQRILIRCDSITTVSALKTLLNGVQLVYKVTTPTDITTTPQQIEALPNQNNLSTPLDGQSIDSVEYREVFAFDDVEKVVSLRVPISMLGTDESGRTTASQSYASGDYFYKDGYMCKALTSISAGATLTLNTNYSQGTLADILKAIENA